MFSTEQIKRGKPIVISITSLLSVGILYWIMMKVTGHGMQCMLYEITGLYCPGCGITRMIYAILDLNFYQAFRYNPYLFVTLPFVGIIAIKVMYEYIINNKHYKIVDTLLIVYAISLILYGILRNIQIFSWLSPTKI